MTIGIIGAMDVEIEGLKSIMKNVETKTICGAEYHSGMLLGKYVVLAKCGVGKVNAAIRTQTLIYKYNPTTIINIGVAGGDSRKLKIGDVVIGESVVQHDMDTSPVGDPKGLISGINLIHIPCTENLIGKIKEASQKIEETDVLIGVVATGDQFLCDKNKIYEIADLFDAIAFDMESGSIGQVCYINKVDFAIVRAISDGGDEDAQMDYPEFVELAAKKAISLICELLPNM